MSNGLIFYTTEVITQFCELRTSVDRSICMVQRTHALLHAFEFMVMLEAMIAYLDLSTNDIALLRILNIGQRMIKCDVL
jgi:hypothetical protein